MPSALVNNSNVSFICARDFVWEGETYKMGEDFDQNIAIGRIELLVRTRRIIPVVDSTDVKPRMFHREVRLRSDVERRLGVSSRDVVTQLDQTDPDQTSERSDSDSVDTTEGLGFDPADHNIDEVMEYVEEHPGEALSVYALEEQGKNRPRLKSRLDEILNQQAEEENEEENTND